MEKPVVATNVAGIPEMMIDNKTGFLVSEGDYKGWIDKLNLLFNDRKLAEIMGKDGRLFVKEMFDWEVVAKKFLNAIKKY